MWNDNWKNKSTSFQKECSRARAEYLHALKKPVETQQQVWADILEQVTPTLFGKEHHFDKIKTPRDFKKQIPIRSYNHYVEWLEQQVHKKENVLSISPIARWLKTSGSTGNSKKIPYTEHWMEHYRVKALKVLFGNYLAYHPEIISNPHATLDTQTIREQPSDFLNGIPFQGITNRQPLINAADWQPPWYDAPWLTPDVPSSYDMRMYYRLRHLAGQDLKAILAINPSTLISLKYHLFKNLNTLVTDIHNGTLLGENAFTPNPQLAKTFSQLEDTPSFHFKEIWPNLSLISCWTVASARLYLPQLERLFPGVRLLPFMTCGTEGIITLPVDDDTYNSPLAMTQGYYEFLPESVDLEKIIENQEPVDTLSFNELQPGQEYHLIISQANGLCRLAVGDIYKVSGYYENVPRLEFIRRLGTYHSFTGEKITESQVQIAMEKTFNHFGLEKNLFIFCPAWSETPHYKLLVEVPRAFDTTLQRHFTIELDKTLCKINSEYHEKRKSHRLGGIEVFYSPIGSIEHYHEMKKMSVNSVQFKYKPFQTDDAVIKHILQESNQPQVLSA